MSARRAVRSDATDTVDELLTVAERLFAERGVENVALTEIVAVSGQKNRSALHYHFGSRGGVLTAMLERRLTVINCLRNAQLDALDTSAPGLAAVVRAAHAPLGLAAACEPWGPDYLSVLAQVTFHPQLLGERSVAPENLTGIRRCLRLVEALLPDLAPDLIRRRFHWLTDSGVFALARWVRDTPPDARTPAEITDLIDQLVAYGVAGLGAPDPNATPHAKSEDTA